MCDDVLGWWRDVVRNESLQGQRGDEWMAQLKGRLDALGGSEEQETIRSGESNNQNSGREPGQGGTDGDD